MCTNRVYEIMSKNVMAVEENDSLALAFELIEESNISGVPVRDMDGRWVGVLSKTDLVTRRLVEAIRRGNRLENLKVNEFMTRCAPITIDQESTVEAAMDRMRLKQIHRLFVTDDEGQIVGVVSTYDVVKLMTEVFKAYL